MKENIFKKDREIIEKTEPGPWISNFEFVEKTISVNDIKNYPIFLGRCYSDDNYRSKDTSRFIAESRTRWPLALDALEASLWAMEKVKKEITLDKPDLNWCWNMLNEAENIVREKLK